MNIVIEGAREHNLRAVSLEIARNALTVFTGVSGSGKSSLVFDTICREGQRRFIEALPNSTRALLGAVERASVTRITGLSPTISLGRRSAGHSPRSTVGTLTEIHDSLRLLFARIGVPHCPRCGDRVEARSADQICDEGIRVLSGRRILVCAPVVWRRKGAHGKVFDSLVGAGFRRLRVDGDIVRVDRSPALLCLDRRKRHSIEVVYDRLRVESASRGRLSESIEKCLALGEGVVNLVDVDVHDPVDHRFTSIFACSRCGARLPDLEPGLFSFNSPAGACAECTGLGTVPRGKGHPCEACGGSRLRPEALAVEVGGIGLADLCRLPVDALGDTMAGLSLDGAAATIGTPILSQIRSRLACLIDVGLAYLSLDRGAVTLSGGETGRVRLAARVDSTLRGVILVLDEPSSGLHWTDRGRLLRTIRRLCDGGNTVLVVEHDRQTMEAADHLVDLGPGGGEEGGTVVARGRMTDVIACPDSVTGAHLSGRVRGEVSRHRAPGRQWLEVFGASLHTIDDLDVRIPLGLLVAVTGVSGSGKSTLLHGIVKPALRGRLRSGSPADDESAPAERHTGQCRELRGHEALAAVVDIDQSLMRPNPRSTAATYTGIFGAIRALFASSRAAVTRGYRAGRFSFNSGDGRCHHCGGSGVEVIEMHFLPAVEITCEGCGGRRYGPETLRITHRGKSIADVLDMTVCEAVDFFHDREDILPVLRVLDELNLGYLRLGQPVSTLSGGEAQRVRLARALGQRASPGKATSGTFFILDEPTTGLHFEDTRVLLEALQKLVDDGDTVLAVTHDLQVVRSADHVIDLGPGAGDEGGRVVAAGTPEDIAGESRSLTGAALRAERAGDVPRIETTPSPGDGVVSEITVRGASQHNLRSVDVSIQHGRLSVVTGVSGSGKSSLAMDTIFAEGQRRYVESLSNRSRRFFGRLPHARVTSIEGLLPAIATAQTDAITSPFSTVGTATEIHDFLRILFSTVGRPHCPECDRELVSTTPARLADETIRQHRGQRGYVLAPVATASPTSFSIDEASVLLGEGHGRLFLGGEEVRLDQDFTAVGDRLREISTSLRDTVSGTSPSPRLHVVIDRVVFGDDARARISDSIERAFEKGDGRAAVAVVSGEERLASRFPACPEAHVSLGENISPAMFSFRSHGGACERCGGRGVLERSGHDVETCPGCRGARLRPESLRVRIGDHSIATLSALCVVGVGSFLDALELDARESRIATSVLEEIARRVRCLVDLGLGYLSLDRRAGTLSAGEAQRIRLTSHLAGQLTGVLHVIDEPTLGLHARDTRRLLEKLRTLRDLGNTLLVVEHEREFIEGADEVIDMGPGAGQRGGRVVAAGSPQAVARSAQSLTGKYLRGELVVTAASRSRRPAAGWIWLRGVKKHNLRDLDARIPLGVLCGMSGVSGSGKSTLAADVLASRLAAGERPEGGDAVDRVALVDQGPIGRTPRSNPATCTGMWDAIRRFFAMLPAAKLKGFGPGRFSFNRPGGRCEHCGGKGARVVEMHFLPDVWLPCDVCRGDRFDRETLSVRYRGLHIGEVLRLDVDSALDIFGDHPRIASVLQTLADVGLGYLALGQSSDTLSGGEAQRLKFAAELARRRSAKTLYILDEPTTGLHFDDVRNLLAVLDRLVDDGASVLVVEHDLDVLAACDWIIDLGPEGGPLGGEIVVAGTPEGVAAEPRSHTGRFLAARLAAMARPATDPAPEP